MNGNEWLPVVSAIANIGFSAVVGWYLLTKAIPDMQKKFSEDMDKQRKDFSDSLASQRADFAAATTREREAHQKVFDLLAGQILDISRRNSDKLDQLLRVHNDIPH